MDIESLGDLDGDGITDLAVGNHYADDGGYDQGAIWILFMNSNGTVKSHQKISDTQGNFTAGFLIQDRFGISISNLGDMDNDGVVDIAVGSYYNSEGGEARGAVYILFLNANGTVKSHQKISDFQGNFTATLENFDYFGRYVKNIGDLDGDGVVDLAVGAHGDDDGGIDKGAVYILFLNSDGTVKVHQKISATQGNFSGTLDNSDYLGTGLENMGDLDGDGNNDLLVNAVFDDDGGADKGALYILYLNSNGTVKNSKKISEGTQGQLASKLTSQGVFGVDISIADDFDGDGIREVFVSEQYAVVDGKKYGKLWLLSFDENQDLKNVSFYSQNNIENIDLEENNAFSHGLCYVGNGYSDNRLDIFCGDWKDDDGGTNRGAFYVLSFEDICNTTEPYDSTFVNDSTVINGNLHNIPNVISPNGDGINDYFVIKGLKVDNLEIYNRWGKLIFKKEDYKNDWEGCDVPDGVYYYYITSENERYKGWLQIIR